MQAQNIRAACSLEALWQGKFVIQRLTAEHLEVAFGKAVAHELKPLLPREPELQPQENTRSPGRATRRPDARQNRRAHSHPQFAHLKLEELRGRYEWTGIRLKVSDLRMEAKKLIRVEGSLTIADEPIDGDLQIGATADVLDTIPGAREKVFIRAHDGYYWTSLKLSGPLKHPHEDLKQRLVAAAEEKLAEGFLAPLFRPGKAILGLLGALYD